MKIAGKTVKGFVVKRLANGTYYGWEPTPAQRKANWRSIKFDARDLGQAIQLCEAHNAKVDEWKAGGAAPGKVTRYTAPQTFNALIDRYEQAMRGRLAANTIAVDKTPIKLLREWAGKHPAHWITRPRVKALRDAMMRGVELNGPGHSAAFHLLTTLRKILAWWIKEDDLDLKNAAHEFGLPALRPREQVWTAPAQAYLREAARGMNLPSIELAFDIAAYIGQRQEDVVTLERNRWREISLAQLGHDQRLHDALISDHGPDAGRVMGIYIKQGKTKRWVGIPIQGELRDRIEAAIAATLKRAKLIATVPPPALIIKEGTNRAWNVDDFKHTFGDVRDVAATLAICDDDPALAAEIAGLQFRDLRRTCIVTLGQLGLNDYQVASITGHSQATIKRILEVYMPRTEAAAASAVVARIGDTARRGEQRKEKTA